MVENVNLFPLFLSLKVSTIATVLAVIIGLPISYYLSRSNGKIADMVDALITLPVVLPPTVLGYYLLVLFGRQSALGKFLEEKLGLLIVFTPTGAVIAAFVVSIPFFIKSARTAFASIEPNLLNAARVLGRSEWNIFFTVIIPLSWRGIVSGITLVFARSLGDFGATLMVAGSIPNETMTMPIAIYDALLAGNQKLANLLVMIMTIVSVTLLYVIKRLEKRIIRGERSFHASRSD
ncbi:molybdate ABC transporter, permease protein [Anoxybacillus flavithermus TNO-09.006]|uniref:Molybdenum transport system permease n=2 Tax=Anoxybacillaceae TaxID=3120669 RepID=A0A178TF82_9BACL|nr:molybdate ABC transporter permease subunit [Anoxybacillus flavithermus]ELK22333.1 molybdate ABC transporter, permease protein [Anoxybacillus flavithermus TNO-09.006]OAO78477.1 Molybdenum transport system permease protein ModB [Anoxybacillus flavithermus]OAO79714.1 Molybdenum transport system permease protein ModB [Anoxybacillus flavithermus]TCL53044.1 molybdate transport system permease protein [Thermolongibacillus altinsuensis]